MNVSDTIQYIGVDDHQIDLFEGQYTVPNGMAYNSYVILDEKIAVMDTVDAHFGKEWLANLNTVLNGKTPDYLIVHHMEPDHSSNIVLFMETYPSATVVATARAFTMMKNFFGNEYADRRIAVGEGDSLCLGSHTLNFITASMVHWPEVMMTYESSEKALFSADGFGKFGANDVEDPEGWACEARRYYFGIVGKYGAQVQGVLKKAANLDIQTICPLHGPVLKEDLGYYIGLYDTWSAYRAECPEEIAIFFTSVYGNTRKAAEMLKTMLEEKGREVAIFDLARDDMAEAVEDAFKCGTAVFATTTYNSSMFPFMRTFLDTLAEHGWRSRRVAFIENGTWAAQAAKHMRNALASCKDLTEIGPTVSIMSALNEGSTAKLKELANALCE